MWTRLFRNSKFLCFLLCTSISGDVFPTWSAEPEYGGKSLTEWLHLYQKADENTSDERQAVAAVRTIGTNGLSQLVKWVASGDLDEQFQAKNGFQILGAAAGSAAPSLGMMLTNTNEVISFMAGQCLGHIGAPALPELLAGLTNRHFKVGTTAALAIVELGTNASPAVPIFLRHLQHPNHFYRERAADALGNLHIEPELVVPALTKLLQDDSKAARYLAISGLENFQSRARTAVPAITAILTDPDEGLREAAINALRKIAPEAITGTPQHGKRE